jgi:glutamate synthase domain-containing protein 3
MTGGVVYVCDRKHLLVERTAPQHVLIESLTAADHRLVIDLLEAHERLTGSRLARAILRRDRGLTTFKRVTSAAPAPAVTAERPLAEEGDNRHVQELSA